MPLNIAEALRWACETLRDSDSPRQDAQVLLCHVLEASRTTLIAWPERLLTQPQEDSFRALVQKRANGQPVAYLIGKREFWSLELQVSEDTLIPRPDTETLVDVALELLTPKQKPSVADLGTGSGAIALALCSERPDAEVIATDQSPEALDVAKVNAAALHLNQLQFSAGSWFDALPNEQRYDLIVSNPPYIRTQDPHLEQGDVRFEPRTALTSGDSGLDDLRHLIALAPEHLKDGGWLALEHGYDQAETVCDLMRRAGYTQVANRLDLGENPRVSFGQFTID